MQEKQMRERRREKSEKKIKTLLPFQLVKSTDFKLKLSLNCQLNKKWYLIDNLLN